MDRKGFPESYDTNQLLRFLSDVKAGRSHVEAPVYSHLTYDVVSGQKVSVDRPDILIVEGVNVLLPSRLPRDGKETPFVSDFFDFSVYLHADEDQLESWYVARFMRLRSTAFRDPRSYFRKYADLSDEEAEATAREHLEADQPAQSARKHPADPRARQPDFDQGREPPHRNGGAAQIIDLAHSLKCGLRLQNGEHAPQVGAAFENQPGLGDHHIGALLARRFRLLDDPVKGGLAAAPEDRENRALRREIEGVITPDALGNHPSINVEDRLQLATVEADDLMSESAVGRWTKRVERGFRRIFAQAEVLARIYRLMMIRFAPKGKGGAFGRDQAARAAAMKARIFSTLFWPGAVSTPEDTSTPGAPVRRIAAATFCASSPPESIQSRFARPRAPS